MHILKIHPMATSWGVGMTDRGQFSTDWYSWFPFKKIIPMATNWEKNTIDGATFSIDGHCWFCN